MDHDHHPPNHHAHFPAFGGFNGLIAAFSMTRGRAGDAEFAFRLSGAAAGATVVDIGCGPGVAVRYAAKRGAKVTGVDPAPVMLKVARFLTRHDARADYVLGSAESLPVADRSVSASWSIATVHHWTDVAGGLSEVRRVLISGGRFVAIERRAVPEAKGHAGHGWSEEQAMGFAEHCSTHGFTEVGIERTTQGKRPLIAVVARAS